MKIRLKSKNSDAVHEFLVIARSDELILITEDGEEFASLTVNTHMIAESDDMRAPANKPTRNFTLHFNTPDNGVKDATGSKAHVYLEMLI